MRPREQTAAPAAKEASALHAPGGGTYVSKALGGDLGPRVRRPPWGTGTEEPGFSPSWSFRIRKPPDS